MSCMRVTYREFIIWQKTCHFRVWSKTQKLYPLGCPVRFQPFSSLAPFQDKPEISWILKHNIHDLRLLPHPLHGELYHSVCLNTFRAVASHQLVQLFVVLIGDKSNELKIRLKSPQIQIYSTGVTFLSYGETESPFLPESESILIRICINLWTCSMAEVSHLSSTISSSSQIFDLSCNASCFTSSRLLAIDWLVGLCSLVREIT